MRWDQVHVIGDGIECNGVMIGVENRRYDLPLFFLFFFPFSKA